MYQSKPKLFYIITGIFIFIILAVIGYFIYTRIFSAQLSFIIAPQSAKITMNGQTFSGGKFTKRVTPGEYTITVEKTGFEAQTTTITAEADKNTSVLIALISNNPDTANWYTDHPEDSALNDDIVSRLYSEEQINFTNEYPIVQDLPITGTAWSINYGICPDKKPFCIIISSTPGNYSYSLEYLATVNGHNYNLSDYPIAFTDYTNPFKNLTDTTNSNYNIILDEITKTNNSALIKTESSGDYIIGYFSYYNPSYNTEKDFYRVILKKEGNNWKVLTPTLLVFYAKNYPDIPKDIINLANKN